MADSPPYRYQALNSTPDSFRVLKLLPAADPKDSLEGKLLHVSSTSFQYIAVSYVWGDPTPTHHITISGYSLRITANLFDVLHNLRLRTGPLYLWADAICINQQDVEERNAQVQKMAGIYRHAARVICWLGHLTPDYEMGLDLLDALRSEDYDAYLEDASLWSAWDALVELLDRPFWRRMWIMQEVM
ncbi:HET-domain-containing protein, partial [Sporormia fimetaria CBS 119925]